MKLIQRSSFRLVIIISVFVVLLFGLYLYSYQQLVTEGSLLADEHCIKINPLIIARKNSYLEEMRLIQASASTEEVQKSLLDYKEANDAYISEEKIWLEKQRNYMDSTAFNLLIPLYIKSASEYQYQMYEADHRSSIYTGQAFSATDQSQQLDLMNKITEETSKSKAASDRYNESWEKNKEMTDWRFKFVKVPPSKCPAENFNIPDTDIPSIPTVPSDANTDVSG